jgi:hypothetical protein
MKSPLLRTCCLAALSVAHLGAKSQPQRRTQSNAKPPCAASLADCPDHGCGTQFDPKLNEAKNITAVDGTPTSRSIWN